MLRLFILQDDHIYIQKGDNVFINFQNVDEFNYYYPEFTLTKGHAINYDPDNNVFKNNSPYTFDQLDNLIDDIVTMIDRKTDPFYNKTIEEALEEEINFQRSLMHNLYFRKWKDHILYDSIINFSVPTTLTLEDKSRMYNTLSREKRTEKTLSEFLKLDHKSLTNFLKPSIDTFTGNIDDLVSDYKEQMQKDLDKLTAHLEKALNTISQSKDFDEIRFFTVEWEGVIDDKPIKT